jgi:4-diphosphocytidyl-2-C-methyl-D-erythritol kinase
MASRPEQARAKINLTLRVCGRRADGYHELDSLVAFADCADTVVLADGQLALDVTGPLAAECGDVSDNLVIKAARLLAERVPALKAGRFTLDKRLPVAAGIGGGSADAAAALRLIAAANGIALDDIRLMEAAEKTGADVPVCIASASCVMSGIGENLSRVELPVLHAVLVNPRVAVPTRDVFTALGLKAGEVFQGSKSVAWPDQPAPASIWIERIAAGVNDLERPAVTVQPVVADVLSALRASDGARLARMSGSGATCFAIFDDAVAASKAAVKLRQKQPGWWVHAGTLS